jgi:hypothetical protein
MLELILTKLNSYTKHEMSSKNSFTEGFLYGTENPFAVDMRFERVSGNHANRSGIIPNMGLNA